MQVPDERHIGLRLRRRLPERLGRLATVAFNTLMRPVPFGVKYAVMGWGRKKRAPYRFLQPGDTVVQVGSARDILNSGRSRAIHLARMVSRGRVVVIEADSANCQALSDVIRRHRIRNITLVESGAWDRKTMLVFLSSPVHPAANFLEEVADVSEESCRGRSYERHMMQVDAVDNILDSLDVPTPSLVCITTNGAELKILDGLKRTIAAGCPYISLAPTGPNYVARMEQLGYEYVARDDRGYCFRKKGLASGETAGVRHCESSVQGGAAPQPRSRSASD
jgi:FkbM family methyltransferase